MIRYVVMLYGRYPLSPRNVEDLLHERGIDAPPPLGVLAHGLHPLAASLGGERLAEAHPSGPCCLMADPEGLPPPLVVTGEYDPQRDEGEAQVSRLRAGGVRVDHTRYAGMIHGFLQMAGVVDAGRRLVNEVGDWVRRTDGELT